MQSGPSAAKNQNGTRRLTQHSKLGRRNEGRVYTSSSSDRENCARGGRHSDRVS